MRHHYSCGDWLQPDQFTNLNMSDNIIYGTYHGCNLATLPMIIFEIIFVLVILFCIFCPKKRNSTKKQDDECFGSESDSDCD